METFTGVFMYCFPAKKNKKLNIYDTEAQLFLQFIRFEIFYKKESSIICTIQLSGVVFGGVLERKLRKLFVPQEMSYISKNMKVVVKTFQCRGRSNFSKGVCQKSYKSNQKWEVMGIKRPPTLYKLPSSSAIKIALIARCFNYANN